MQEWQAIHPSVISPFYRTISSKLNPTVVLFLVGVNDIGRDDLNDSDKSNMTDNYPNIFTFLSKKANCVM